jgi:hypothetical protein
MYSVAPAQVTGSNIQGGALNANIATAAAVVKIALMARVPQGNWVRRSISSTP